MIGGEYFENTIVGGSPLSGSFTAPAGWFNDPASTCTTGDFVWGDPTAFGEALQEGGRGDAVGGDHVPGDDLGSSVERARDSAGTQILVEVSMGLGEAMPGLEMSSLAPEERLAERGW